MTTATQHLQYAKAVRKAQRRIKDILSSPVLTTALQTHALQVRDFEVALICNAVYRSMKSSQPITKPHIAASNSCLTT